MTWAPLAALIDLVVPSACGGCRAPGAALCPACAAVFAAPRPVAPGVYALAGYHGVARSVVLAYKEQHVFGLASPLGALLADGVGALWGTGPLWLVPAPSRPLASSARGGAHMARLARRAAGAVGGWRAAPMLRLSGAARDSVGLTARDRVANLAGRVSVNPAWRVPGARVVLLDDVVTTGATVGACVSALTGADMVVLGALALTAAGLDRGAGSR